MKINEAIEKYKALRKGQTFKNEQLIGWLSDLDGMIYNNIIITHADAENVAYAPFNLFDDNYDGDKTLLVPEPYSEIYIHYLLNQADYCLNETARYENSRKMFIEAYQKYENYYHSKHRPAKTYTINI